MLDAHPNVVVAHEYFLFQKLHQYKLHNNRSKLFNAIYRNSYRSAVVGWRTTRMDTKGYSLHMNGSWQGRFSKLKVIGDKSGGNVADTYMQRSDKFKVTYQELRNTTRVPIKILHVIRNPFDMIATETLYRGSRIPDTKVNATVSHKYTNFALLESVTDNVFRLSNAIFHMIHELQLSPLQVHCEDLISHPAETISNICRFLDLECSREYLQMCAEKTFKTISASRLLVKWDPIILSTLKRRILKFPFFYRYYNTKL